MKGRTLMKIYYYTLFISFLFLIIINCNGRSSKDKEEEIYTGLLEIIIPYKEPLKETRIIKIWVIERGEIDRDCMGKSFDPESYPVTAYNEIEYSREDYENKVSPKWEVELPQQTYTIVVRGYNESNQLVSIGCKWEVFVIGGGRNEVSVGLYYAK